MHVSASRARGRIHVAVGVHPDEAERLTFSPHEIRGRRDRPGREAVITAEHERESTSIEDAERGLVELLAEARDLADVLLLRIPERLDLGDWSDQVALVDDGDPECGEAFGEAGDAKCRRPHVDAAATAAEVERDANEVESLRVHHR